MAALDTNVLVRYLVQDDAPQLAAAKRIVRAAVRANETLFVPITVMLELEWVLRSNYGFPKSDVVLTLSGLLSSVELSFESEAAAEVALALYQQHANTRRSFPIACMWRSRTVPGKAHSGRSINPPRRCMERDCFEPRLASSALRQALRRPK